ncbi:MAG: glycosyltransferase family 39 protein [Candidatus Omnitrophica bacterium]|nr:glycosyltransferase family 39 protein [Candidatus Omnitrophota bacterium]
MVSVFGNTEYALRLFPLICGIISLFLFCFVARHYIKPKAVPIALALFAVSDSLIYYSSEVHSYSSDITIVLLLLILTTYTQSKKPALLHYIVFGIGGIVVWFSHSSPFALAGIGASLFLFSLIRKEWMRVRNLSIAYLLWIVAFISYYLIYIGNINKSPIVEQWKDEGAFMPFPPLSPSDIAWFIDTFFSIFAKPTLTISQNTSMMAVGGIAAFAFIMGCISIFRERREIFFILIAPAVVTLLASGLHLYPFLERTLLFLAPAFILIIAEGTEEIRDSTSRKLPVMGTVFICLLLSYPLISAANHLLNKPIVREEIKPLLSYVRKNWQEGDILYLHYGSKPAFKYYADRYGFTDKDYIVGAFAGDKNDFFEFTVDNLNEFTSDLDKLRGSKRLWILFAHIPPPRAGIKDESFFVYYLNSIGSKLDFLKSADSSVYLYDLGEKEEVKR